MNNTTTTMTSSNLTEESVLSTSNFSNSFSQLSSTIISNVTPTSIADMLREVAETGSHLLAHQDLSLYSNLESSVIEPVPTQSATNETAAYAFKCNPGLFLPCWQSDGALSTIILHGIVYLIALIYMFVGVAIIADRFMLSIEQITSQEQDVVVRKKDGTKEIISVRIWNETVSNLTLMALGSSAPEIMLSVIEIYAQGFNAGELGPGTIVGSAAFNMFIIIAVCVWAVPDGSLKKIKFLRVFIVTLTFSIFAYVWMLAILVWISPAVIEVWEGLVTLGFFFITVGLAYVADRRLLFYKYMKKHYQINKNSPTSNGKASKLEEGDEAEKVELTNIGHGEENGTADGIPADLPGPVHKNLKFIDASDEDLRIIEDQRDNVIEILKYVKQQYPTATADEIETLARNEIIKLEPKSRAYYRIIAARRYFGSNSDVRGSFDNAASDARLSSLDEQSNARFEDRLVTVDILFDPMEYTVMENVGKVSLTLTRLGDLASTIVVNYETENGSAKAGSDYVAKGGQLVFGPGEAHKQIQITIINDDEFEDDEHFFVAITDAHYQAAAVDTSQRPEIRVVTPKAKVNILDDDHSGIFGFLNNVFQIPETIGVYRLAVNRYCGARGSVSVPFRTIPATARPGVDYVEQSGELHFHNNETQKEISLEIINNTMYEMNSIFYVELGEPTRTDEKNIDVRGAPRLGDLTKCMIRIRESKEFKLVVDALMRRRKWKAGNRASSWENQLTGAMRVPHLSSASSLSYEGTGESPCRRSPDRANALASVEGGSDTKDQAGDDEPKSAFDYVCHYLMLFWKLLFAFVPPPTIWNGWACFVVSIIVIGVLTSFINDLASHFGATVHLKDSVTAISLVALGTSVPDTFASKIAAENEERADASIGNVTGSNAVNVFLGIGLAWTVAAIYHAFKGTPGGFHVEPGNLSFSVTLFCICAFICSAVLVFRRYYIGGELGGSRLAKVVTVICFVGLWLFYLSMSTLEAYGFISAF